MNIKIDCEQQAVQAATLEESILLGLPVEDFNFYQFYLQNNGLKPLLCQCNLTDYCFTQEQDAQFTPELAECGTCGRWVPWCYLVALDSDQCCDCGGGGGLN